MKVGLGLLSFGGGRTKNISAIRRTIEELDLEVAVFSGHRKGALLHPDAIKVYLAFSRLNRRFRPEELFSRTLAACVDGPPITYAELTL